MCVSGEHVCAFIWLNYYAAFTGGVRMNDTSLNDYPLLANYCLPTAFIKTAALFPSRSLFATLPPSFPLFLSLVLTLRHCVGVNSDLSYCRASKGPSSTCGLCLSITHTHKQLYHHGQVSNYLSLPPFSHILLAKNTSDTFSVSHTHPMSHSQISNRKTSYCTVQDTVYGAWYWSLYL